MSVENLNHVWPKWKLVEQLGEGSFGKVYKMVRTEHTLISYAAVKVISIPQNNAELESMRAEGLGEKGTRSYFEGIVTDCVNEIRLMESMKGNTNVVSVEDYKVIEKKEGIGWEIFIRMEILTPLNSYIADKQLTEADVRKIGQDVCAALHLCNQLNIIHRDIKLENIFVSSFGDFKVGDFGIARKLEKASDSLSQKGTYNYMAPEVVTSKCYDATVDIYSLGLVLYRLLNNNRMPFLDPHTQLIQYQDRKNAIDRRLSGETLPAPVNASPYMAEVIHKACAFNPSERFQTPFDFREALMQIKVELNPNHIPLPNYDETAVVRQAPKELHSSKSSSEENRRNERSTKKKKPRNKIVLVPICLLFIITAIVLGFVINQRDDDTSNVNEFMTEEDIDDNSSNDIELLHDVDTVEHTENESVDIPEVHGLRLMDVSRLHSPTTARSWVHESLLPRKIDEHSNANSTYSHGLRIQVAGTTSPATIIWNDPYSYISFDLGVTGNGGATVQIDGRRRTDGERAIIWGGRTIPPGQIVSLNLNVSEFDRIFIHSSLATNHRDTIVWMLDPMIFAAGASGISAHDDIIEFVLEEAPLPTNTPTPLPTNTPTPLPTEAISNDELAENSDILALNGSSLSTAEVINSNNYRVSDQLFISATGHRYHESFEFSARADGDYFDMEFSYAIFNLGNSYTTFFAEVVAPIYLDENLEFLIEIAFDDDPVPVITIEDFNVAMATVPVELDVTGVTNMYIIVRGRGRGEVPGFESIRFGNAILQ